MFSNDPYVHEMYKKLLGDNVHWQDREAWIYSKNVYTRYPFQGSLYGLPPDVIKECIVGRHRGPVRVIERSPPEADGQRLTPTGTANGNAAGTANGHGKSSRSGAARRRTAKPSRITDCCGDGVAESTVALMRSRERGGERSAARCRAGRGTSRSSSTRCGARASRSTSPSRTTARSGRCRSTEMETSWLGGRVPMPDLEEMIDGALRPVAEADGAERPLRLPAARRLPGAHGRLPAAAARRDCGCNARVTRVVAVGAHS